MVSHVMINIVFMYVQICLTLYINYLFDKSVLNTKCTIETTNL